MASKKTFQEETGIILTATYFVLFVINAVIIYLANFFFPQFAVLGTITIPLYWAIIHSAGVLALLGTMAIPVVHEYENWREKMLTTNEWMISYFILNFVGIWLIARFPEQFGFGISIWLVAFVLAIILDFVQGIAMTSLQKLQ